MCFSNHVFSLMIEFKSFWCWVEGRKAEEQRGKKLNVKEQEIDACWYKV